MHLKNPQSARPGRLAFRCPSCLNVLAVDSRLAGTAASCPLCTAQIVAPQPIAHGIPLAAIVGAQAFQPASFETAPGTDEITGAPLSSRRGLAGSGVSQVSMQKNDKSATTRMIVFAILTIGACLLAAVLLLRG